MSQQLTDIPADRVGEIVRGFVRDGMRTINCRKQDNGMWTVTAS